MKITEEMLEHVESVLEEDFKIVRRKVQKAMEASPKTITFEEAKKQVENNLKCVVIT